MKNGEGGRQYRRETFAIRPIWTTDEYYQKNSNSTSNNTTTRKLLAYQVFPFWHPGHQKRLRVIRLQDASTPTPLPQRTPLHRCHRTRQCPLPDRAGAIRTTAPPEAPTRPTGGPVLPQVTAATPRVFRKSSPSKCNWRLKTTGSLGHGWSKH